nr:MAG TPA: protein of unknown function (DUF5527) [Caudoviricetes sp.]
MTDPVAHLTSPAGVHVAVPASQLPLWERLGYVRRGPAGHTTTTDD